MSRQSPLGIINCVFFGFVISLVYGVLGSAIVYFMDSKNQAKLFLAAYNTWFNTLIASGLLLGTALVVFKTENIVPTVIERAFAPDQLAKSDYFAYKHRFTSTKRSVAFAAELFVAGFALFLLCQFPLEKLAESLMILASCLQYALGAYILRKIVYAGLMLHSLLNIPLTRNLLKARELDEVYVFTVLGSILMIASGYAHTIGYFDGPFKYERYGEGIKIVLAFPALIAGPMLALIACHSIVVVKRIYRKSARASKSVAAKPNLKKTLDPQSTEPDVSAQARRFRIALSFAGEKRDYIAKIAVLLATRFGEAKVLYDRFHEAEFARRDLGFYLPDLYHNASDLVVIVVCRNYESKEWCGLEWDAIFDLLKKRKSEEIMLCRFEHASPRGVYSTAGFLELDDLPAEQATLRILERLALNEGKPKNFYLSATRPE